MDKLIFTITDAGRQAIINASNTGTEKVEIKSVGIGDMYYITTPDQTEIGGEIKRITGIGGTVISPDTIHVTAKDDTKDEYVVHTVGLYTDKGTLFAVYSRAEPIINKSASTVMLISSDITFKSIDTANITFGDVVFINPPASESVVGVSRFATAEEVEEGLDPAIAVSAKRLKGELDKKANLDSPNLTGTPTAPTTAESDNSQKIATTAFIKQVLLAYAKLDSPNFTGKPTAPTADQSSNDTQLATTAFVRSAIAALVDSSPGALDTLNELAAALGNDPNFATTMTNALAGKMDKAANGADIPNKPLFLQNVGLVDVLFKGDGRFLAGTFVSDAIDRTSIGARAATGCQFMRAHQAPDAPDQVSFWQIITLSEVVSPTTVVDVLAVSGNNVLFGHGTGAGITSWRQVAMLEGGAFTGGISAPNMRGDTLVTVGDGTGGMAKGDVDGAGFNGNNLNIKSWNGIGFQNSEDLAIRVYISTRLGVIAAAENLQAGSAIFNKNGDVYGDIWGGGSGPGWLSAFVASKPARQYITMVGVYQNDKTKPFMLHDDGSGVFLATTDMLSGYVQSIRFGAVEHGNLYRSPGFADQLGYVITGVENGDSNDTPDRIQRRLLQLKVNGQWYTVGA